MRKQIKNKNPILYKNIPCDSMLEKYTLYYLFELENAGYIKQDSIKRGETLILFDAVSRTYIEKLKTKSITKSEILLEGCVYTYDFEFELTEKGVNFNKLFKDIKTHERIFNIKEYSMIHHDGKVFIEVKPKFAINKSDTREKFSVVRKWTWQKYNKYICLFIPEFVFPKTFTPELFKTTESSKKQKKINWKITSLKDFENGK